MHHEIHRSVPVGMSRSDTQTRSLLLAFLCVLVAGGPSPSPSGRPVLALVAGYQGDLNSNSTTVEVWDGQSWSRTSSLSDGRRDFELAKLSDGRVIAAGGSVYSTSGPSAGSSPLNFTEIWDGRTWQTSGGMLAVGARNFSRQGFKMVALEDGRALAAGGYYPTGNIQQPSQGSATAEIWDPADGQWRETGSMKYARQGAFGMVLLEDGRVLVAGGSTAADPLGGGASSSAEVWDPEDGAFTPTGNMSIARTGDFALSLLSDGRDSETELWDPDSGEWYDGGPLTTLGYKPSMVAIENRTELFLTSLDYPTFTTTEVWEPKGGGDWRRAGAFTQPAESRQAGLLSDGRVLVVGTPLDASGANAMTGGDPALVNATLAAETFNPVTLTTSPAGSLTTLKLVTGVRGTLGLSGQFRLVTL